jgi:phenylacetate-coenzyme A ligase PaaK-like adenylate-forming protein
LATQKGRTMQWNHKIFRVKKGDFEALALQVFRLQSIENPVYKAYLEALNVNPLLVNSIGDIPFLPIRFFKSHAVQTGLFEPEAIFESSGTTGSINSRHLVKDISLYEQSFINGFELFYGAIKDYCIIGLLPSYLERKNASLVFMVNKMVQLSEHPASGFYLDEYEKLFTLLTELESKKQKTLLIGVTFALLDFAEKYSPESYRQPLKHTIIMETGGMKGRRKEMIRQEVQEKLCKSFRVNAIHSEYGMTELLSQAYSKGDGIFNCPPWMKILLRDEEDPLLVKENGPGIINVIDLANINSCSFIATDDAGRLNNDGTFEVLGRVDGSDVRGCSLLTAN